MGGFVTKVEDRSFEDGVFIHVRREGVLVQNQNNFPIRLKAKKKDAHGQALNFDDNQTRLDPEGNHLVTGVIHDEILLANSEKNFTSDTSVVWKGNVYEFEAFAIDVEDGFCDPGHGQKMFTQSLTGGKFWLKLTVENTRAKRGGSQKEDPQISTKVPSNESEAKFCATSFTDPTQFLPPVEGVMGAPKLALNEALAKQSSDKEALAKTIDYAYEFADAKLKHEPDPFGLDREEIAALYLYTTDSIYQALNKQLRLEDRSKLKVYFSYIRLLLSALGKIPNHAGTVYRGVKLDLKSKYEKGCIFYEWTFMSTTEDGGALQDPTFLGVSGQRSLLAFHIECGKNISKYSAYTKEKEILVPPGYKFKVENLMEVPGADGLVTYNIFQASDASYMS